MKTRSFFSVLAAIVLVLVLAGAAGAYWLTTNNPLRLQQRVEQSSAKAGVFISRQAPVMVSLLVNPDRLTAVDLLTTAPTQRKQVQTRWRQFRQDLLSSRQLDYNQDIRPWLGNEITLAVTTPDLDRDSSNGQQVGYLVAAAIKDAQQAEQAIQTYWQRRAIAGLNLVFEQYAGVKIIHDGLATEATRRSSDTTPTSAASPLATAVIADRFVLFANHPKVLRDAINNFQVPELSLEATVPYQQALEQLSEPHVGMVYAYLPQLAAWLGQPALDTVSDATASSPLFDSLVMALTLDQQSIVSDTMLLVAPGQSLTLAQSSPFEPGQASQYVPPVTPVAATGKDLYQLWTGLETSLEGYEPLKALLEKPLNSLNQQWQLNLPDEIFPWVDGEYAFGLLPNPSRTGGDWVFVAERTPTFLSGLTELDAIAQEQGLTVSNFNLAEQPITAWTKLSVTPVAIDAAATRQRQSVTLQAEVQGVHTTVGNYEVLATSLDAVAQAIQTGQYSLPVNEELQQAIALLPSPNQGYLYVDWQSLDSLGNWSSKIEQRLPPIAKPFIDRLRSVTISNYETRPGGVHSVIVIRL
ncbi:MAG: DUF3352 domain-containing protein [Elainellaceae cyanobacterium]